MWIWVLETVGSLLARAGFSWLTSHRKKETDNVENKVNGMSDADVADELVHWTRPDTKPDI